MGSASNQEVALRVRGLKWDPQDGGTSRQCGAAWRPGHPYWREVQYSIRLNQGGYGVMKQHIIKSARERYTCDRRIHRDNKSWTNSMPAESVADG